MSSKLLQLETSNLVRSFVLGKPSGRTNNFPQKGRGLGQYQYQYHKGAGLYKTAP